MKRRGTLARMARMPGAVIGGVVLLLLLGVAFIGPLVTPLSPSEIVSLPGQPSTPNYPIGTDFLGRDVLSRLLAGGRTVVLIGFTATMISYLIGGALGIYVGLKGGLSDFVSMRVVDILLTVPGILYLMLLSSGLGSHNWVLVLGVIIVLFPPISRVVRTAAVSVAKMGYVEAALARGDGVLTVCRRDIFPNILPNILADFGIRFSVSILLVAGMNFLGLGLSPPAADWGLMTSENQSIISLNAWAVVAPASMLAMLSVSINLIADAYLRALSGPSGSGTKKRRGAAKVIIAQPGSVPAPAGTAANARTAEPA